MHSDRHRPDRCPRQLLLLAALATGTIALAAGCARPGTGPAEQPADAVLYARVITMDPSVERAKGLAIREGRIVRVASPEALRPLVGPDTKIFNWRRYTVVPGLIDAHVDLLALGETMVGLDLEDSGGMDDIASRVRAVLAERGLGKQRWIVGYGWDEQRFRESTAVDRAKLDEVAPARPILLFRADRRSALANGEALRLAGLDRGSADPPGGRLGRRSDGNLSGLLTGRAVKVVQRLLPTHGTEVRRALLKAALGRLVEAGYTTVHDMGGDSETWEALRALAVQGELPIRVLASVPASDPLLPTLLANGPQVGLFDQHLTLRTVRLDLDGELGAQTAQLLEPYADAVGETGLAISSSEELTELAQRSYEAGFQLAIHASGDGAVRRVLDVLEALRPSWSRWDAVRPRLEGVDLVHPDDVSRFGKLQLLASLQPARASRQIHWLGDRLGEERLERAHPWGSLERAEAPFALGSGAPELPADPRTVFTAAVNREDETGWPPGGWKPMERLRAPEALRGLTSRAAWAGFEEEQKGSIRPGKLADLTVFSRDILYTDPEDLYRLRVLGTIVGGRIKFRTRHLR